MLSSYNNPFLLGTKPYHLYFDISLSSNQTWISLQLLNHDSLYNHNTNIIQNNISITISNANVQVDIINDYISFIGFENNKVQLNLIILPERIESHYDTLALGVKFDDIKYSLVHQLYNENYISKKHLQLELIPIIIGNTFIMEVYLQQ
jgi:hypothetical protein